MKKNKQHTHLFEMHFHDAWRPALAWIYVFINLFDFLAAPILLSIYTFHTKQSYIPWQPLTVQGGGIFHLAMGAVLGVTSWGKSQEKLGGVYNNRFEHPNDINQQGPFNEPPAEIAVPHVDTEVMPKAKKF